MREEEYSRRGRQSCGGNVRPGAQTIAAIGRRGRDLVPREGRADRRPERGAPRQKAEDMSVRELKLSLQLHNVDMASFLEKDELINALNEAREYNAGNPPQRTPEAISRGDGPIETEEVEIGIDATGGQFGKKIYRCGDLVAVYEGRFRDGKRSGAGTLTWFNDGGKYCGEWKDDRPHGRGTMTYPNGDVYSGRFEDGKRCGRGAYKWVKIGDSYTGSWRDDKKHGFGARRYSKGDLYHGQWERGKRHGDGAIKYAAGGAFSGGWREGRKHGRGVRTYADGKERAGEWRDGRRVGTEAATGQSPPSRPRPGDGGEPSPNPNKKLLHPAKAGAATGKFPLSRRSPGGDEGGPSPDSDGAGEIPNRGPAPEEPPARSDASPPSQGGARGRDRSCAELTDKDFAFLEMGRELVREGTNKLHAILVEERSALRDLTANMVDIERSLESLQELPSSLSNLGPDVAKYFSFFTSAFERAYVAAQALSSGAVKVQLNLSLEAFFDGTSWVAENCGLPFVGFVSVFSAMMAHQQSAKKTKAFVVFEEFFRGNSRDQYLLTYRKLGEQFSLQLDVSSLARSDPLKTSKLEERVKNNIVAPIRKYLRKNHLDAIKQLSPIEKKAMAHLASLTKEVLRLHKDERHTYQNLSASNEYDKASYFVGHIFGKPLESVHPKQNPIDGTRARNTNYSDGDTGAALQRMWEEVKRLKKITDANANAFSANADIAQEFEQVKAQVKKLAAEPNSQKDVTVPNGCQLQVRLNPDNPKEDLVHQLAGHPYNFAQMEQDIHQLQILHEKQSRNVEKMKLEHFINNRVLSYHEAFKFAGTIISMVRTSDGGKIELSDHGNFDYDGKNYRIGVVCKGGMFSTKRTLWKGRVEIKLETEYRGVKSIMDWFDKTELLPLYERNKKEAIHAIFAEELESEPCLADMVQPYRYCDAEGDREKLGI